MAVEKGQAVNSKIISPLIGVIGEESKEFCNLHSGSNFRVRVPQSVASATVEFTIEGRRIALIEIASCDNWVASPSRVIQSVKKVLRTVAESRETLDGMVILDDLSTRQQQNDYENIVKELCRNSTPSPIVLAGKGRLEMAGSNSNIRFQASVVQCIGTRESGYRILETLLKHTPMPYQELEPIVRSYAMEQYALQAQGIARKRREELHYQQQLQLVETTLGDAGGKAVDSCGSTEDMDIDVYQPLSGNKQTEAEGMAQELEDVGRLASPSELDMKPEVLALRDIVDNLSQVVAAHGSQLEAQKATFDDLKTQLRIPRPPDRADAGDQQSLDSRLDDTLPEREVTHVGHELTTNVNVKHKHKQEQAGVSASCETIAQEQLEAENRALRERVKADRVVALLLLVMWLVWLTVV